MNGCLILLALTKHATILTHMFTIAENNSITVLLYDPSQVQNPNMTNEVSVFSNSVRLVSLNS